MMSRADREALYEALDDLMAATDPASSAAQDLAAEIDSAINDAATEFGSWLNVQAGNEPPAPELLAAVQAMHAAALSLQVDWTPQLFPGGS